MTTREYYVMGWIFGAITRADGGSSIGGDVTLAVMHPFAAQAQIITKAQQKGLLTGVLDQQIMEAMGEINSIPDESPEVAPPMEMQGAWQIGYFQGRGGLPLARETFDIGAARKSKRLTQSQLADLMGVDQALISRWESGKVSPNKDNLQRLKNLLLQRGDQQPCDFPL